MSTLRASVQYGDWEGTAAADDADQFNLRDLLAKKGGLKAGEFVVAVELWIGENVGGKVKPPYIEAIILDKADFDTVKATLDSTPDPLKLKKVKVDVTLDEFIGLFKRFAVTLSRRGLNLTNREYTAQLERGNARDCPNRHRLLLAGSGRLRPRGRDEDVAQRR